MGAKGVVSCLVVVGLIAGACSGGDDEPAQAARSTASVPADPLDVMYKPVPVWGSPESKDWIGSNPEYGTDPVQASIVRVIDGDTFEVTGGARVRALGINSCEMSTPGGAEAKRAAEFLIGPGDTVLLTSEPGVDLDRYDRALRYIHRNGGGDFGVDMVWHDHTGVYEGRNDASPEYVALLREKDQFNGRDCSGPPAAPAPVSDDHYVPVPNGDDDDHKSRFCRRHWYC